MTQAPGTHLLAAGESVEGVTLANKERKRVEVSGHESQPVGSDAAGSPRPDGNHKMKRKEYEHELRRLHGELVAVQEWVKDSGAKICIVFEGRDTAGKGGTIKAITERVSPRVFRVVALPAPDCPRKVTDVHSAVPASTSRRLVRS